jgi:hypothetical protein
MRSAARHTVALLILIFTLAGTQITCAEEAVLCWDDGVWDSFAHRVTGQIGMKVAVRFQAPEWANWVTEIRYYISDDELPTPTDPFLAYVWKPSAGPPILPDEPANLGVDSGAGYPKNAWLELTFPEAVYIGDPSEFPDRVFFVGLEWTHRNDPVLWVDYSDPVDDMSWRFNWAVWELWEYGDIMIRAVVSDSWVSPVESRTWSRIKGLYRQPSARLPN